MRQLVYITLTLFVSSSLSHNTGQRFYKSVLFVYNGGTWGTWRWREMCPYGYYAAGFSLKVENSSSLHNTGLNGIRLHCVDTVGGRSRLSSYKEVTSDTGSWGEWTEDKWCKSGFLMNFQLQVEPFTKNRANNIKFQCSGGDELFGLGTYWGNWGGWSKWCTGKGICGLQTKIEGPQGLEDDTALNDVQFFCCS